MSEAGGGFGGESLYLQCPRLDEERNNAYANFANRAQDNYQRELQAHNDMLDEYRRKLEYAKALQRMSSDYEDDDESPDYMQSLTVPAHLGRSSDERSFQSFSGLTTRSNSADDVRDFAHSRIENENSDDWSEGISFEPNQLNFEGLNFEEDGDEYTDQDYEPDHVHRPPYPAPEPTTFSVPRSPRIPQNVHYLANSKSLSIPNTHDSLSGNADYDSQEVDDYYAPSFDEEIAEKHWNGDQHGEDDPDSQTPKECRSRLPDPSDNDHITAFPTRLDRRTPFVPGNTAHHEPSDADLNPMQRSNDYSWPRSGHRLDGLEPVPEEGMMDGSPVTPPLAPLTPGGHFRVPDMPLPLSDHLRNRYAPMEEAGRNRPGEAQLPMHDFLRRNDLADYGHQLESDRHLEDEERRRRWDERLRFQELEERERRRQWHQMDAMRRRDLGLHGDTQRKLYAQQMLPSHGGHGGGMPFGGPGNGYPFSSGHGMPTPGMGSGGLSSLPGTIIPGQMSTVPTNLGMAPNVPPVPLGHGFNPVIPPLAPAPIGFGVSPHVNSLDLHPSGNNGRDRFSSEFLDDFRGLNAKLREALSEKIAALTDLNAHRVAIPNLPRRN